jgi:peptide/nickel transport system permease protein
VLRFSLVRLTQAIASIAVVEVVVFFISRLSGDPTAGLLGPEASPQERATLRHQLGLDQSLIAQFWLFVRHTLTLDFGRSYYYNAPVMELIGQRLPNTIYLAVVAMCIAGVVGMTIGILGARRPGGGIDTVGRGVAVLGQSVPTFVSGLLFILAFAVTLRLVPSGGKSSWDSVILPAITLAWFSAAALARISRSSMREALTAQYVTVARAKGVREHHLLLRHALRNSLTTVLSLGALQFVALVNGAVITESVFNWPGIGQLLVQGSFARDYPLVQGLVFVTAVSTIVINFVTDVLYATVDPRVSVTS